MAEAVRRGEVYLVSLDPTLGEEIAEIVGGEWGGVTARA